MAFLRTFQSLWNIFKYQNPEEIQFITSLHFSISYLTWRNAFFFAVNTEWIKIGPNIKNSYSYGVTERNSEYGGWNRLFQDYAI